MCRVVILGAPGRDFHAVNLLFRDDASTQVGAFTAAPIPPVCGSQAVGGVVDAYPDLSHLDFELEEIASPTMADALAPQVAHGRGANRRTGHAGPRRQRRPAPPDGKELQ